MIKLNNNDIAGVKLGNSDVKLYIGDNKIYELDPFNGFEYVDLGLPSGTLWAKCNVGASNETDYGNYYQWGKGSSQHLSTYQQPMYMEEIDTLPENLDTATQVMGGQWHMPTTDQFNELITNTTYQYITINNINGYKFIGQNNNYIFLPQAGTYYNNELNALNSSGYYWSSTGHKSESGNFDINNAENLYFNKSKIEVDYCTRNFGMAIRGVVG